MDKIGCIVVGAGVIGLAVARRLAQAGREVVVLEAGPQDKGKPIHVPTAFSGLFRRAVDWDYLTEPQPELNDRRI